MTSERRGPAGLVEGAFGALPPAACRACRPAAGRVVIDTETLPPPGRRLMAWFAPRRREFVIRWPLVRQLPPGLLPALVAHEVAHAALWWAGSPHWRDEGAADAPARAWGFPVEDLDAYRCP